MQGDENIQPDNDSFASLMNAFDQPGAEEVIEQEEPEEGEQEEEQEEPAEEEESEEEESGETFTIKHDGKEVTLSKAELIEMSQKGFDYTQKTMHVAEELKQVENRAQKLAEVETQQNQASEQLVANMDALAEFLQSELGEAPPISLAQTNSSEYLVLKEAHEIRKGQLNQLWQARNNLMEEQARTRQARLNHEAEQTMRALQSLPGWKDADKSFSEAREYLASHGLEPQLAPEVFVKKGLWEMAQKAREYDRLLAEKEKLTPTSKLPKVQTPSKTNSLPSSKVKHTEAIKRFDANPNSRKAFEALF